MIDFNKLEEYVAEHSKFERFMDIPYKPFIFRDEEITEDDMKKVVTIFNKYGFDKRNIAKIAEKREESKYRLQGKERGFLFLLTCSNCGEKFLIEKDVVSPSINKRYEFFFHFFDDEHFYSYNETKTCGIKEMTWKMFNYGNSKHNVYICKGCYEKIEAEYLEKTKEEREQKRLEQERIKAEEERKKQEEKERIEAEKAKAEEKIQNKVSEYIEKYNNKSFDFYDAIGLFLKAENNDENIDIINGIIHSGISMMDFMKVAFDEPQKQEKRDYICGFYSFDSYHDFFKTPYWELITMLKKSYNPNCEFCGSTEHLNIHHKEYQGVHGAEHLEENIKNKLVCLCNNCHRKVHKVISVH